jgi:MoaA/NifB/PqqE/SkfB family radical SAM enzyme
MYNVFLLSQCNLRCDYCFADEFMGRGTNQQNTTDSAMSTMRIEDYDRILDFLEASRVPIVSLVGGEPTLHPDFFEIVQMSLESGFSVSIKSNAVWTEEVVRGIHQLPDEGVHFHLNINPPSALGTHLWQKISRNVDQLKGRNVVFQCNIDRVDFEYQPIIELANQVGTRKIVWSLSNMVKGAESESFSDPIAIRQKYSNLLLTFIREAGELEIQTVGVHGITPCMFGEQDYQELLSNGGSLKSTCRPVFDFLPDLSVLYCFPMSGFWGKKYIYDYEDLQELGMEFQDTLAFLQSDLYPLDECGKCEHFRREMCHGGCIARHIDGYEEPELMDARFFDRIPLVSENFRLEKRSLRDNGGPAEAGFLIDIRSGKKYEIDLQLYALIDSIDGKRSFGDLSQNAFPKFERGKSAESIIREVITQLIRRGVLKLKPYRKTDVPLPASYLKV